MSYCQAVVGVNSSSVRLLQQLTLDISELDVGNIIQVLAAPVCPARFLREFVASNKPVLIRGAIDHWPALQQWSPELLKARAGQQQISVDVTPNGFGDAVTPHIAADGQEGHCFCIPHKRHMSFENFLYLFYNNSSTEIPYLQQQNSNLTEELPSLLPDVDGQLDFAAAAFQAPPDAVNLWIGDERSTTTYHKDHYENLYAVVRGRKVFYLLPPTDAYRMGLQRYPTAQFKPVNGRLEPLLQDPPNSVMWCPIHPEPQDLDTARQEHPLYFDDSLPKPLRVEVGPGDVLYLPAMWWHYVQQKADPKQGWCVAVNYW
eukprot:GHRR01022979.1.p1 GENE.GHRR01022979.1~~GHRR01022979.1.p1  ORF type:complete len:316 (+),score=99.04 GHRR01022979.1:221-1168(+)